MRPGRLWLTLATLLALAVLCGLGTWQLQRLAWKERLIARIEAARTAPVEPIERVARRRAGGADVAWSRVLVRCRPGAIDASYARYSLFQGEIAWRQMTPCRYARNASGVIWADRGVILSAIGDVEAPALTFDEPETLIGVLREQTQGDGRRSTGPLAGYMLAVEREAPQPRNLRPEPLPPEISNRHLGYAITWFGLAAALVGVYAAVLLKDRRNGRAAPG